MEETLEESEEDLEESPSHKREPHAKPGRRGTKPGGGRYNESKAKVAMTEAKIREILQKAIQFAQKKGK